MRFARKFHFQNEPRSKFVAFENAFHGRTMGALALTWKELETEWPFHVFASTFLFGTWPFHGLFCHSSSIF